MPPPRNLAARAALGGAVAFFVAAAAAWGLTRPALPEPAAATIPPFKMGTVAGGANAEPLYLKAADALGPRPIDFTPLDAPGAGPAQVRQVVDAAKDQLAAHPEAAEGLAAGHARLAFQAVGLDAGVAALAEDPPRHERLAGFARLATHAAFVAGVGGDGSEGLARAAEALALVGRLGRSAGEPLPVAALGAALVGRWDHDMKLHEKAVLGAPGPAIEALLGDLNRLAATRRTPQDMALGHREWVAQAVARNEWPKGPAPAPFDRLDAGQRDRAAIHAERAAAMFRPRFDRWLPAIGKRDLAALRAEPAPAMPGGAAMAFHPTEATAAAMLAMCDGLAPQLEAIWTADARLDAWRVRLAAELHRREKQAPAKDLATLVPTWLAAEPLDPFSATGAALRYEGGKVVSVGPDGKGTFTP